MPLPVGDLDPEDPLQPAPERHGDLDAFVKGLDLPLELGGRDVSALQAASPAGVPPDAAEVAEAALGDHVVELRAALGADQRALQVVVVLPAPLST
ncbi:MAG TPA: hypothetical protein VFZ41_00330 [Solirubrobacterales bacterium]